MTGSALVDDLKGCVGPDHVFSTPTSTEAYGTDWTRRWSARPVAAVRPANPDEIAAVLLVCAAHGIAVVPQGGNTGLVGGSVPRPGTSTVVLSTRRLTRLDPVDVAARQVVAGAGVLVGDLQRHAAAAGLRYGVNFAARDSATVGGTIATNAGGLRVLAHGDTRRQVVGVEAVLADGSVVSRLTGLAKDNSGYDLSQLLVGSEGTLGIVTAARLRLLPGPGVPAHVALVGLPDVSVALSFLDLPGLTAAELILDRGLAVVEEVAGLRHPLAARHPAYLLLEVEGDLPEDLADLDTAVGPDLWAYRERHTEAIATRGAVLKLDVGVPVGAVPTFVAALNAAWGGALSDAAATREAYVFGHVGDGNLHVNVVQRDGEDSERLERTVYELVAELGGTVAAEHGVGVAKTRWLPLSRSPAELAAQRAIKDALDPGNLLNPGVLFA